MTDHLGRNGLRDLDQVIQRDHGSRVGAHVELRDVLSPRAELLVGLDVHAIGTIVEIEIIHVGRAHVHAQRVGNLLQRHVEALRLLTINRHQELRIICRVAGEHSLQTLSPVALPHDVASDIGQFLQSVSTLILHFKLEAAEFSQALDRGREERNHECSIHPEQRAAQ